MEVRERNPRTMAGVKEQVIRLIEALPDDVTADDVLAEIYFKMQVDAGLKELDAGQAISHQAMKERMAQWTSLLVGASGGTQIKAFHDR